MFRRGHSEKGADSAALVAGATAVTTGLLASGSSILRLLNRCQKQLAPRATFLWCSVANAQRHIDELVELGHTNVTLIFEAQYRMVKITDPVGVFIILFHKKKLFMKRDAILYDGGFTLRDVKSLWHLFLGGDHVQTDRVEDRGDS